MMTPTRYLTLWRLREKDGGEEGQLKVYGETIRIVRKRERQGGEGERERETGTMERAR